MTDAERIAVVLRIRASEVDVALTYADSYDRTWEGSLDIGALMAMLSDVRREEREALAARKCPHCGRSDLHDAICAAVLSDGLCPVSGFRVDK